MATLFHDDQPCYIAKQEAQRARTTPLIMRDGGKNAHDDDDDINERKTTATMTKPFKAKYQKKQACLPYFHVQFVLLFFFFFLGCGICKYLTRK